MQTGDAAVCHGEAADLTFGYQVQYGVDVGDLSVLAAHCLFLRIFLLCRFFA